VTADGIRTELLRIANLSLEGGVEELQNVPQATLVFCLCRQRGEVHHEVDCGLVQISSLFYLEVANNEFFQLIVKVCYSNSNWQTGIKQVSDQPVTGYTRSEGNLLQVSFGDYQQCRLSHLGWLLLARKQNTFLQQRDEFVKDLIKATLKSVLPVHLIYFLDFRVETNQ